MELILICSNCLFIIFLSVLLINYIFFNDLNDNSYSIKLFKFIISIFILFIALIEIYIFFNKSKYLKSLLPDNTIDGVVILNYSQNILVICSILFILFIPILLFAQLSPNIYNDYAMILDILIRIFNIILLILVDKIYKNKYKYQLYPNKEIKDDNKPKQKNN